MIDAVSSLPSPETAPTNAHLLSDDFLFWTHILANGGLGIGELSLSAGLFLLYRYRKDFRFSGLAYILGSLLTACAVTHVMSVYTLWYPAYYLQGILKAVAGVSGLAIAAAFWAAFPSLLRASSLAQVQQAHLELQAEQEQRRSAEAQLQRFRDMEASADQIRQSQKMEAIGQLTGGIAHDFNNLLTVITGTIEELADAVSDRPHLAAIANLIDQAATRGATLTRSLLAFARKQPLQPIRIDVNATILSNLGMLRPTLEETITVETRLAPDLMPALVDKNQLEIALLNIVLNARDAMPDGGRIVIETSHRDSEQLAIPPGTLPPGGYVGIAVTDSGKGIAPDMIERVFEPFFTTKEVGKGTGLGLSMVYGFVKQSDGHVMIDSALGRGTTVTMLFPESDGLLDQEISRAADTPQAVEVAVLVVEDDAMVRASITKQIKRLGWVVHEAGDADQAMAILNGPDAIDVLFTDIVIPGRMSGRRLAEQALVIRPGLHIVFTSGYAQPDPDDGDRWPGPLLKKPFRTDQLIDILKQCGDAVRARTPNPAE